jgi:prephenate dehydrogenase
VGLTVAVAGLGLIGGSLARTLVAGGVEVVAFDPDPATREAAEDAGIRAVHSVGALAATGPDVLILAVPLAAMTAVAREVAAALPGGSETVVTDVGSVKAPVRAAVEAAGLGDRYVGAHPMAGTELSGFEASDADLLPGAAWAVTVAPSTRPAHLLTVLGLVAGPLRGRARVVSDAAHDDAVALVSHVPHVLATELLNQVAAAPARDLALGLAAGSFRDGTRVAQTDPRRTEAMVAGNAAAVARALRAAAAELTALADALEASGGADSADSAHGGPLHTFFDAADPVRELLAVRADAAPAPSTDDPTSPVTVVPLTDPGWRERLTALGEEGAVVVGLDPAADPPTVSVRPGR